MKEIPSEVAAYNREIARKLRRIFTPVCENLSRAVSDVTTEEIQSYVREALIGFVNYSASKYDIYSESAPTLEFMSSNKQTANIPENIPSYFTSFLRHQNEVAVNKPYNLATILTGSFENYLWSPIYRSVSEVNNHAAETLVVPIGEYGLDETVLMLLTSYVLCRLTDKLAEEAIKIETQEWNILSEETLRGRKKAEKLQQGLITEVNSVLDSFKEGIQSVQATVSGLTAKRVGTFDFESLLEKVFKEKFPQKIAYKVPFSYTLPSIRQGIYHEYVFENQLLSDDTLKLSHAFMEYCKETQALYQQTRIFVDGKRNPGLLGTGCPLAQKESGYANVGIQYVTQAYLDMYKKLKQMVNVDHLKQKIVIVDIGQPQALPEKTEKPDEIKTYNIDPEKIMIANEKVNVLTDFHKLTHDVLLFWFKQLPLESFPSKEVREKWFSANPEYDAEVREKFSAYIEALSKDKFLDLRRSPTETVALIILLDQLSRNAFRGTSKAFGQDELALQLAKELVDSGADKKLPLAARWFVYMPYQHSESLELQQESVLLFSDLLASAETDEEKSVLSDTLGYAKEHEETIKRFGRFPYRNDALGRECSVDEIKFLKERENLAPAKASYSSYFKGAMAILYKISMGFFYKAAPAEKNTATKNILVINASPKLEGSSSRELSRYFVENWSTQFSTDEISYRDVGQNPIPHFTHDSVDAVQSPQCDSEASEFTRQLSRELIAEIKKADTIVISVPIYNGSIPSGLKSYFDHIAVDGLTWGGVKYGENKKVIVMTTGGGNYIGTEKDFLTPYIKFFLSTIDLNNVEFVHAHKLCFGDETKTASLEAAKSEFDAYVSREVQARSCARISL